VRHRLVPSFQSPTRCRSPAPSLVKVSQQTGQWEMRLPVQDFPQGLCVDIGEPFDGTEAETILTEITLPLALRAFDINDFHATPFKWDRSLASFFFASTHAARSRPVWTPPAR
jgi:hypothetical protein